MMEVKQLVPALRFKEFDGEWEKVTLFDLSDNVSYGMNASAIAFDGVHKYLRITDIDEETGTFKPKPLTSPDGEISDKFKLQKDDIVFTRTGASVGKPYLYNEKDGDLYYAGFLIKFSITKGDSYFIYNLTQKEAYNKWVHVYSMRSGQPGLNAEEYKALKLSIPSLPEQQKIASFLSAVDEKIQQLTKKKELLEHYKKGVMQQLFSGKLRFKDADGKDYPDWKPRKMSEVLFEHKLNSTGKEEVFSVSVHKGLINQVEHLGRVFAAKNTDNYNLVQPGDIVYTKSPTGSFPLGIIKQSKIDKNVIVSPLYGIFTPETPGLGYMFNVYFESPINTQNYLASIIQKGAKNTINITNTTFLSKKMKLPTSKAEQNEIGNFLKELDTKIERVNQQITQTQTFKKGLLQQMFV